jgi:hypothetical protein
MRTLSNRDFLELWERGTALHPLDRALLVLSAALPGERYDTLALWPLGSRNAALKNLHCACFGSTLEGWIACPQCGERLEFSIDASSIDSNVIHNDAGPDNLTINGRTFRPLNSRDLAAIANAPNEHTAALQLLPQCCLQDAEFSEDDLEFIGAQLAQADPLAETLLDFACAACGHRWHEPLDIAAWLWSEIEARARRLLLDVHALAGAYGWSETEILSLSESRRALYLEMVQA